MLKLLVSGRWNFTTVKDWASLDQTRELWALFFE